MSPLQQAQSPAGFSILPITPSIISMSWSCFHEDQEESSASKLAHTALIPAAERSVKFTEFGLMSPSSLLHVVVNGSLKTRQNGNQFCFLEKGRRWAIPGFSTTFLAIDEKQILNTHGTFPKTWNKKGGFPAHPALGRASVLWATQAHIDLPDFAPRLWKHSAVVGWQRTHLWRVAAVWAPALKLLFFCEYGDDVIKNWFSDTKRVSKNVKQRVNQKNKHTCEELVRKEMEV